MSEIMWLSLALGRLAIRAEQLEQENLALRMELEKAKGLRSVEPPKEGNDANVPVATE